MPRIHLAAILTLALAASAFPCPVAAQGTPDGLRAELLQDVNTLERKIVSLAEAMDACDYGWVPMEGVRTVAQVYLHIAATNYFFPTLAGVPAPRRTYVTADYESAVTFEAAGGTKEEIVQALSDSFQHLRMAIAEVEDWDRSVEFFGQRATVRRVFLVSITHAHEHLGQAIAYTRANGVVPPWSR